MPNNELKEFVVDYMTNRSYPKYKEIGRVMQGKDSADLWKQIEKELYEYEYIVDLHIKRYYKYN